MPRVNNKINLPTNTTDIKMLAKYLEAIKDKGIVSVEEEQALFSAVKSEHSRKKKDSHKRDTHTKKALELYGLINKNEDGSFSVSSLGNEVVACFDEESNFSQEDTLALMLKVFVRMEITDEQNNRHIHIGFILIKLLSDPLMDYYITTHELAHLVMNSTFINDNQYEQIRDYVLQFRNTDAGISPYTPQTKASTFLATFVNNWNFLVAENVELTQKQEKLADKYFANYMNSAVEAENQEDEAEDADEESAENAPENISEDATDGESAPGSELTDSQKNAFRAFHTITKYRLNGLAAYIAHLYLALLEGINVKDYLSYFSTDNSKGPASIAANNLDVCIDLSPIILYGPPGTGKTHKLQTKYISRFSIKDRFVTTFHQSFSYEEFVEGLKPVLFAENLQGDTNGEANSDIIGETDVDASGDVKYKIEHGIFRKACERAVELAGYKSLKECIDDSFENRQIAFSQAINNKKCVLLAIDEINRGNVVSIFGDLISLIENNKRLGDNKQSEMILSLPYSQDRFGVPANLLIVGTMNTADRSIQLLDSALRRRFRFEELLPDYSVFTTDDVNLKAVKESAKTILQRINARIRCVLNKDNQIGHSYLMNVTNNKEIVAAIVNKIIPLLEEYFYNEIEKVRFVLNEGDNTKHPFYIVDTEAKEAYKTYLSADDTDEEKSFYTVDGTIAKIINEDECGKYLKHLLGEDE